MTCSVQPAQEIRERVGASPIVLSAASAAGTNVYVTPRTAAGLIDADSGGANLRKMCRAVFVTG